MTVYTAYEVRVFRDADWRVEAVLDDESLAIAAARKIEARLPRLPVVVVQEVYDAARNHLQSQSVYRSEPAVRAASTDGRTMPSSAVRGPARPSDTAPAGTLRTVRAGETASAGTYMSWALFGLLVAALSAYAILRTTVG